jgi:Ran GTPase-activating protein (RanGAP) involved in mRNA processing and transport
MKKLFLFKNIIQALASSDTLHTFIFTQNLNSSGFEIGWKLLFKFFQVSSHLRNVILAESFIQDKHINELIESLKHKKLHTLDLSSNFLTAEGAVKLSEFLKKDKNLKILKLQQNSKLDFKKEGCAAIIDSIYKHHHIKTLDLSSMNLTGFGNSVAKLIQENTSLQELRIKNARMNCEDFKLICQAMETNSNIEELNIGDNNAENLTAYEYISSMIEKNKNLKTIGLEKMHLSVKKTKNVIEALISNTTIQKFYLNDNPKLKILFILDIFIKKANLNLLHIANKETIVKRSRDEFEAIEIFKIKKPEVSFRA